MRALEDLNSTDGQVTRYQYSTYFIVSGWDSPAVEFRGFKFHDIKYAKERIKAYGHDSVLLTSMELTEELNAGRFNSEHYSFIHCYVRK